MNVRRLGPGDEAVVRVAMGRLGGSPKADPVEFLSDRRTLAFAVEVGSDVVGWLYAHELQRPDGRREVLLYSIDVDPRWRGRGCGRELIGALLAEAKLRGSSDVWTLADHDNEVARNLYRRTGGGTGQPQVMYSWDISP